MASPWTSQQALHPHKDWVTDLVGMEDQFFRPCPACAAGSQPTSRDFQVNYYDVETHMGLCSHCLSQQRDLDGHRLLQIRRSSYHDVVKVADIQKLVDITGIAPYSINSAKVIFLKRRAQPRPSKAPAMGSACHSCLRPLQDGHIYCSLQCKYESEFEPSSPSGAHTPPVTPLRDEVGSHSASDGYLSQDSYEFTYHPPVSRRKGRPHRSPLE